jgi:hypothetical protein
MCGLNPACDLPPDVRAIVDKLCVHSATLWPDAVGGDALDVGRGYLGLASLLTVMGSTGNTAPTDRCGDVAAAMPYMINAALNAGASPIGLLDKPSTSMTTEQYEARMAAVPQQQPAEPIEPGLASSSARPSSDPAIAYASLSGWW